MKRFYGTFYDEGAHLDLDGNHVPESVHPLLPYASFWGITDDGYREDLRQQAPPNVIDDLRAAVNAYDDELDEWLVGPEADSEDPTLEYLAFSAMRMLV